MLTFSIDSIKATYTAPLYLTLPGGGRVTIPNREQVLWEAPNNPRPNAVAAFALAGPRSYVGLSVTCKFSSDFVGKTWVLMGFLGNAGVISSYVKVTNTKPVVVRSFYLMNGRTCPVAYRGSFSWSLLKDSELKTYGECKTSTFLEFYMAVTPPAKLWPSYGISVNLLRQYLPAWGLYNGGWGAADFYRYITQVIINGGEFVFDNVNGDARYAFSGFGISYKLDKYLQELESGKAERINSYDMAGIMQIILSLFPNYDQVSWNYMRPYGWINTTKLKGWPTDSCNNPFWLNRSFDNRPLAPINYAPGRMPRSSFEMHAFITAPVSSGVCVLDATSGPHMGGENMAAYLKNAIDHYTNYYTIFPGNGPGNIQDISPYHAGITSLNNSTSKATASATKSTFIDSVESAIKRAKIANADPAHFSRIDPITLKSVLEQTSNLKLTFETTELGESGSELQLSLSTFPEVVEQEGPGSELHLTLDTSSDVVEVTLVILDSHEAAITRMRHALSCISAPLDVVLAQTKPLGHYSLQGIGYAVFVRGNVFVKMTALPSYKELDTIAAEVDRYLKERAGGPKSLSKSRIESLGVLSRVVKVGETFEVAVKVAEAGSMTAFTNPGIVQLLEVDAENATFKFHGTAAGTIDIQLVFAHEDTLQTTTATVHVEVIDDGPENKQGPVEPPVKYHGRG